MPGSGCQWDKEGQCVALTTCLPALLLPGLPWVGRVLFPELWCSPGCSEEQNGVLALWVAGSLWSGSDHSFHFSSCLLLMFQGQMGDCCFTAIQGHCFPGYRAVEGFWTSCQGFSSDLFRGSPGAGLSASVKGLDGLL